MSFLDKDRIVAPPGFSRWMIPPAALCVVHDHKARERSYELLAKAYGLTPRK